MNSWVKIFAETEDMEKVNDFIIDLQSLMDKHGVWMNVEQSADEDFPIVEFNHIANEKEETDWWIEMVDLWPHTTVTLR